MSEVTHAKVRFTCDKSIKVLPISDIQELKLKKPTNKRDFNPNALYNALWVDSKNPEGVILSVQVGELACGEQERKTLEKKRISFPTVTTSDLDKFSAESSSEISNNIASRTRKRQRTEKNTQIANAKKDSNKKNLKKFKQTTAHMQSRKPLDDSINGKSSEISIATLQEIHNSLQELRRNAVSPCKWSDEEGEKTDEEFNSKGLVDPTKSKDSTSIRSPAHNEDAPQTPKSSNQSGHMMSKQSSILDTNVQLKEKRNACGTLNSSTHYNSAPHMPESSNPSNPMTSKQSSILDTNAQLKEKSGGTLNSSTHDDSAPHTLGNVDFDLQQLHEDEYEMDHNNSDLSVPSIESNLEELVEHDKNRRSNESAQGRRGLNNIEHAEVREDPANLLPAIAPLQEQIGLGGNEALQDIDNRNNENRGRARLPRRPNHYTYWRLKRQRADVLDGVDAQVDLSNRLVVPDAEDIDPEGRVKYEVIGEKTYLGGGKMVKTEAWNVTKKRSAWIFLKDVSQMIWGKRTLVNRCVNPSQAYIRLIDRSPRKQMTPRKYKVVKELFDDYLEDHENLKSKKMLMFNKMNLKIGEKIKDLRESNYEEIKDNNIIN